MLSVQRVVFVAVLAILALLASPIAHVYSRSDYESLNANEKWQIIWHRIHQDTESASYPNSLSFSWIFAQDPNVSFDHVSDEMPHGRSKLIHSVGNVAGIKFIPSTKNIYYDGIFEGANHGFVRCSYPFAPNDADSYDSAEFGVQPACAFKFLRSGVPSANILAMQSYDPQSDSFNFFKNAMSNHIPPYYPLSLSKSLMYQKFEAASKWPGYVGLSDFARYTEDGEQVHNPEFPFMLVFRPASLLTSMFPDDKDEFFTHQLRSIPTNTTLFNVFAKDTYMSAPVYIGRIQSTTPFVTSKYGDEKLFFKHQRFDDDVEIRPEMINGKDSQWNVMDVCYVQSDDRFACKFDTVFYPDPNAGH